MAIMDKRKVRKNAIRQAQAQSTQPAPDSRLQLTDDQKQQLIANAPLTPATQLQQNAPQMAQNQQINEQMSYDEQSKEIARQAKIDNNRANPPVTDLVVRMAAERLKKYKTGKANLEQRLIANEDYWKLRQWNHIDKKMAGGVIPINTAWLWNCISAKHADLMDAMPESNIRPKRQDDIPEAERLSSIVPVIFEENNYIDTYSELCSYALKQGVMSAGVFWDGSKHDGLGDITIKKVDLLELFWESGIENIQDSKEVFQLKYESNDKLKKMYPEVAERIFTAKDISKAEYKYDDNIDTTDKAIVVHWYYKKIDDTGNEVLHYCQFCNGVVLFATENDIERYPNGWYDHAMYPFIIKPLFKVEGSIAGYGYTDIGRGDQNAIDILTSAILTNAVTTAKPRYFIRTDGNINEAEYADLSKDFIHVMGNLDEVSVREVSHIGLPTNVIDLRDRLIDEMKESLGNRDVNNGGTASGITAASAIAAMQEQGGKMSRDHNRIMYQFHKEITDMVIELIRQFYNVPREYRITGKMGEDVFVQYDNRGLQPQPQPSILGIQMGLRLPCFDIEVNAQKATPYSKMEQNELALQLYNSAVFNPQNVDQALALLETMDFKHKDEVMQRVSANGTMLQKYQQLQKVAFQLAQMVNPQMAEMLAQAILAENGQNPMEMSATAPSATMPESTFDGTLKQSEHPFVERARANSQQASQIE